MLKVTADATTFPVTLAEASEHCEAPGNGDDNARVLRSLKAAIEYAERRTGLAFARRSYEYRLDEWPCTPEVLLPIAPVIDVLSVTYLDEGGDEIEIADDDWTWERTSDGATIVFGVDFDRPTLEDRRRGAVRISFEAGFDDPAESGSGDDPDLKLPETAKLAVLMLTAHWYENREAVSFQESFPVVVSANSLLDQMRVYR